MKCCVFVCEDFPKENQKLANKATPIGQAQNSNFLYTMLQTVFYKLYPSVNFANPFFTLVVFPVMDSYSKIVESP